ncbi:MAG: zinc ribbon domain-containing protein [Hyphomicrobiales bacterium]|nr:zinc ribbon domain-containing protein [Hyphomicrobiales bacterium]MBV8823870.1 zinc ribbon domain-containing protein [Hyphomicrobiales bacterium]
MPVYDYLCEDCGPFTDLRPMAECERPHRCPECGRQAPRVLLTAPNLAAMSMGRRLAFATNERSAHAPTALSGLVGRHAAGCSCCAPFPKRKTARGRNGAKSFPSARPWMISH